MGFLTTGNTFSWEEASEKPTEFVRKHGIAQFLNTYTYLKDRTRDSLRWGDEVSVRKLYDTMRIDIIIDSIVIV
jgi:glutamate--cysteine ligase catalytic subunit